MLMGDGWQPAVLQLLPFSPNHAGQPPHPHHPHHHHHPSSAPSLALTPTPTHPNSSLLQQQHQQPPSSSSPSPRFSNSADGSRGFPVLAVTRKDKTVAETGTGSKGSETGGNKSGRWGGAWTPTPSAGGMTRASSERLVRSQTFVDGGGGGGYGGVSLSSSSSLSLPMPVPQQPRARSEYMTHGHRNGGASTAGTQGRAKSSGLQSREHATCSVTDMNERLIPRVGLRPESTSPDSGAGSLRNASYVISAAPETAVQNGVGSNARGFPKPAFPANALSPSNTTAAGVIGNGSVGEGRCVVTKNGMWRSVTLTPGEVELKRHRDLLERVTTVPSGGGRGDAKLQYHKLNIRDLPRSTTPVNDHDPDKLNMKQVIAFLQSKGKSQADAVELPRGLKTKTNHKVTLPRTIKSGVFKGSMRKPTPSSTAADILTRSSARSSLMDSRDSSPGGTQRTESGASTLRTSASLQLSRNATAVSSRSTKEEKERKREHRERSESLGGGGSSSKLHRKPFRLHRFLTMVPTAREVTSASSSSFSSLPPAGTCPLYSAVPLESPPSKSAHKERTLCLDLASQSKTQTTQSRSVDSKQQGKVHYRLASRPRPSSLRVEQDLLDAQWKLSTDFGDRGGDTTDRVRMTASEAAHHAKTKEKNDVIRLPFVMMDSEEEDTGCPSDSKKSARARKKTQHAKPSRLGSDLKQEVKNETAPETGGGDTDAVWPTDVQEDPEPQAPTRTSLAEEKDEAPPLHSSSQLSTTSSMLPAPAESMSSLVTVCPSDAASDRVPTEDSAEDKLPDVLSDTGLVHLREGNTEVKTGSVGKPAPNRQVKVNLPSDKDPPKDALAKQKLPDCVTLSLRKERHRTREDTYMSEIAGSDVFSDDTCAARVNSESMRMSFRSEDVTSLAS